MITLNKKEIETFSKGMDSFYSVLIEFTAPIGHESTSSMINNLTLMDSGNKPLRIHGEIEVMGTSSNVAQVKWTQTQWAELDEELVASFDWLNRIKLDGHVSDWKQLPINH
jgi:hypothetical protein